MGYSRCGIIFGSVLLALVCGCASYYDYACPEAPDGYMVVDSYANGRAYDWIKVENRLPDRIDVFVIEHDAKERVWRAFADDSVSVDERVELEPKPKRRLKENRYYAVWVPGVESKCISHDVKSNLLNEHERNLLAVKYHLSIPTEEELQRELQRERAVFEEAPLLLRRRRVPCCAIGANATTLNVSSIRKI